MTALQRQGTALADDARGTQGSAPRASVQEIIDAAATTEAFAVTLLGVALDNAAKGTLALDAEQQQALRAARAAEQAHYDCLLGMGAKPTTTAFTLPDPRIVADVPIFLRALIDLEESSVAAYIAAAQAFAILGEARLAQVALQIGAIEAEHRVAGRLYAIDAGILSGTPNDVAFEKALYSRVDQAEAMLRRSGFIDGAGGRIDYPGPGAIDNTGVSELVP